MDLSHVVFGRFHGDYHEGNIERIALLYRSLDKFDQDGTLGNRYVVCPDQDVKEVAGILPKGIRVIADSEIVPNLDRYHCSSWFKQQFLKLSFHNQCETKFFMTMDCENFATNNFSQQNIIQSGRALMDITWKFDRYEWWLASAAFLGLESSIIPEHVMHVTPCIYSKVAINDMKKYIEDRFFSDWQSIMLGQFSESIFDPKWIENGIYFLYLASCRKLNDFHFFREEFGVDPLHSEGEVWIKEQWQDWDPKTCFSTQSLGMFSVIQSNTHLTAKEIEEKIGPFLS